MRIEPSRLVSVLFGGALVLGMGACWEGGGPGGGGDGTGTGDDGGDGGGGGMDPDEEPPEPEDALDKAKEELPTYIDLHQKVIWRTCTPNDGVCHNDKEYPDLHTPQSMLGSISQPCNIAVEDPIDTFNGCEKPGDTFKFLYGANGDWQSEIAWVEFVDQGNTMDVEIHLRDAIPEAMNDPADLDSAEFSRVYDDGETLVLTNIYNAFVYAKGESVVTLKDFGMQSDSRQALLEEGLWLGDPNRDGVFGAEDATWQMITPGDPSSSYLLGRLQATVPGTPMPLANQPLDSAEMLALLCWIEGLAGDGTDDVYAKIDYDGCNAADDFGQPQPDSGHSFSNDVMPIFASFCNGGGCHSGDMPAEGLDLADGDVRGTLLRPSVQDDTTFLVMPGNPTNSYLMLKLYGKGVSGVRMPRGPSGEAEPLPDEFQDVIERWIAAGAPAD